MSLDTFVVLANQYNNETDALADYDAVRKLYADTGIIDTYDAAVLTRKSNGKVEIIKDDLNLWLSGCEQGIRCTMTLHARFSRCCPTTQTGDDSWIVC